MKRLFPASLKTYLQSTPNSIVADCFAVSLSNGATFYATDAPFDVTFQASTPGWTGAQTTFRASQYGVWFRGAIMSEAGTDCRSNTMDLTVLASGVDFPGTSLDLYAAARAQLFDAATVRVYTAYMPVSRFGDVSNGVEPKWIGQVIKATPVRGKIEFQVADPLYLTNLKIPSRLMQSGCPWGFCDRNCGLAAADFTVSFAAAAGSTSALLTPTAAFAQTAGYFDQGVVTGLTGANAGLSQTVKSSVGGIVPVSAFLLPIAAGDTFSAIKGCDKTLTMCKASVQADGVSIDNSLNNGSTPFIPPPSVAI